MAPAFLWQVEATATVNSGSRGAQPADEKLDNSTCLICHGAKAEKLTMLGTEEETRTLQAIQENQFGKGVRGEMTRVGCRPDKLPPPDIVMFTGTQSLEEFKLEHTLQYQRLVDSGQLEKCLV